LRLVPPGGIKCIHSEIEFPQLAKSSVINLLICIGSYRKIKGFIELHLEMSPVKGPVLSGFIIYILGNRAGGIAFCPEPDLPDGPISRRTAIHECRLPILSGPPQSHRIVFCIVLHVLNMPVPLFLRDDDLNLMKGLLGKERFIAAVVG